MPDFATLVLGADTRGLLKGVTALEDVVVAGAKAEKAADGVHKSTTKVRDEFGRFIPKAKQVGDSFKGAGDEAAKAAPKIKNTGVEMSGAHAAALKAAKALGAMAGAYVSLQAASAALNFARQFNAALAETSTLIEGTPEQLNQITASAREMSKAYGGTATDQVKAYYQAISAGAEDVATATTTLDAANKLAIGGATDVSTAVGILSGVINSYGKDAITATEVSDALFVGMKAGVTTVGELSSNLGAVIPTAKALGISFDEVVAATAALTKNNMTTSAAVTSLNAALTGVVKPTAEATKLAASLGLEFNAAGLQAQGLGGFLAEVAAKTGGNVETMAQLFGSVEALKAALLFAGEAGGQYTEIMEQMGMKTGATKEAFDKMSENLDFRWNKAMAAAADLMLVFGNALLTVVVPALEGAVAVLVFVVNNFDLLVSVVVGLAVTQLPALVASMVTVTTGASLMAVALSAAAAAGTALGAVVAFLGGPITLAVGAAAALGTALYLTSESAEDVRAKAAATAESYRIAAVEAAKVSTFKLPGPTAEDAAEIKAYLDASVIANGGITAEMAKQYEYWAKTRVESEAAAKVANEMLASYQQQAEMARLINVYGEDSLEVAAFRHQAEMDVLRAQLQSMQVAESMKLEILAAADATFQVSNAAALARDAIASMAGGFGPAIAAAGRLVSILGGIGGMITGIAGQLSRLAGIAPVVNKVTSVFTKFGSVARYVADAVVTKFNVAMDGIGGGVGGGGGGGGGSAGRAADAMDDATNAAEKLKEEMNRPLVSAIDGVSNAFGDFIVGGLRDFKGFAQSILKSFTNMLSQMIAMAARNRIMISMGLAGGGAAGTAAAAAVPGAAAGGGGIAGGLLGKSLGGLLGSWGGTGGILGGLSGVVSGFSTGGIGGALSSIGSSLSGAFSGGIAGVGSAIGAVIPVLGIAAAAFSFFRKKVTELDAGVRVSVDGMDALVQGFRTIETKKFWGLSKKVSTNLTDLDAEVAGPMEKAIADILGGIVNTAGALGVASSAFDDFTTEINVSTKGMSDSEAQAAVTGALNILSDQFAGMVGGLKELQVEGEGFADTLTRLLRDLNAVNETLYLFDRAALDMSLAGADAASKLVQLSGGLDAFTAKTQFVFENMLTETGQNARLTEIAMDSLNATFGDLQFAIPATHAEFMALLDAQDLMTERGRQTYAALQDVASAFVQVNGTAQQAADSIRAMRAAEVASAREVMQNRATEANQALTDAEAALRAAFAAERDRLTSTYQAQQDAADALARATSQAAQDRIALRRSIIDALQDALDDRRAITRAEQTMRLSEATGFLRSALAAGGTDDLEALEKALAVVADPSTDLFKSFEEYQHSFNVNTSLIKGLRDVSGDALSVEEKMLGATQTQTGVIQSGFNAQLTALDAQMNALLGIDNSVLSLGAAIAGFKAAEKAVAAVVSPIDAPSTTFQPGSFGAELDAAFRESLGRGVRQGAVDYYGKQYDGSDPLYPGGRSLADIKAEIAASAEAQRYRQTGIPKFASGGAHMGGMRMVGENGPELEVTGPSRIYSSAQTRAMMDTSRLEAQLAELNDRTRYMQDKLKTLARIANDQNINGTPGTREGAVVATQEVV